MGDTKAGREKQADDAEQRQREHELEEALDRADEPEPAAERDRELGGLDAELEGREYPMTTDDVIAACGDREVETRGGSRSVGEVLAPVGDERYDSPDDVRSRILGLVRRE